MFSSIRNTLLRLKSLSNWKTVMDQNVIDSNCHSLPYLSFHEVNNVFKRRPALIVPLGGCEPFANAALGTESVCCDRVAHALAERLDILVAPLLPFGCSVPFMSFPGSSGIKPRTFINLMLELIHCYIFQGITNLVLLNAAPFNCEPLKEVLKRLRKKYSEIRVTVFDFNLDSRIREFASLDSTGCGNDRNEKLFLSLLSFLAPELLHGRKGEFSMKAASDKKYRIWRKRGRDPQKYRSLFPNGLVCADAADCDPQKGRDIFEFLVNTAQSDISTLLEPDESRTADA